MMGQYGRGRGGPSAYAGMQQKQFGAANQYYRDDDQDDESVDDDDMEDYGMDQYYEEDDSDDNGAVDPNYMQNMPPGSLFQGGPPTNMGVPGQRPMIGMAQKPGGVNATSGVPFYGQQNRMPPQPTYGAMAGMGAMAGGMGMSLGGAGAMGGIGGGGGGFTYGMASQGGSLFGPPSTGPAGLGTQSTFGVGGAAAKQAPGIFQFGGASQFGGIGTAGSMFGAGAGLGMGVSDDPYANIAIDLTKVKKSEPPAKLYEHKTEEEKKQEQSKKAATGANAQNVSTKSNLKNNFEKEEDSKKQNGRKRSVTFGGATKYEFEGEDESGEFNKQDVGEGGRGSPRPDKKIVEIKDLSDGRNEKEKIKDLMEQQEREQLEEIKRMSEWKPAESKQSPEKDKGYSKQDYDESIGESSSMSNMPIQPKKAKDNESSYESDAFEDASVSGSGGKQKLTYWPGKDQVLIKKGDDSVSVSQSHDKSDNVYDAGLMDAYMKKQQQLKDNGASSKPAQKSPSQRFEASESSEKYDDDFESISKSQSGMTNIMLQNPNVKPVVQSKTQSTAPNKAFDYKAQISQQTQQQQPAAQFKSVLETYVKKENKLIQTDQGKYSYMGAEEAMEEGGSTFKEWRLESNLKDAEGLIQEMKATEASQKQRIYDIEEQYKKKDVEFSTLKRDQLNTTESLKRLQDQYKDALHKNNLYKIETEELIKQIDLADAKTREKEDELRLARDEYDRKLTLQEERILFRRSKQDDREIYEVKRQNAIEKEALQRKLDEKTEELDYFNQKVMKLENENKRLIVGFDGNKRIKELEDQVEQLKNEALLSQPVYEQENQTLNLNKNRYNSKKPTENKEDLKIQNEKQKYNREIQQLELMIKGYQEENEKSSTKIKMQDNQLKQIQERLAVEQQKVKDLQQRALLDKDKVYVEESKDDIDIKTCNTMGLSNAISQKQLQELYDQVKKLSLEKSDVERDFNLKDGQYKASLNKVRDEKSSLEKKLYEVEFVVGEKEREYMKLKEESMIEKDQMKQLIEELESKVTWFRENQKILTEDDEKRHQEHVEYQQLKERAKQQNEELKKTRDLEKKCKLLEETIKSKNPNSIPMLIQATKAQIGEESVATKDLKEKIQRLEHELDERDKEYEKRVRALRQEQEKVKQTFEKKAVKSEESKRILELEEEIQNTKNYYNKRIREIEDKYKFRINNSQPDTSKKVNKPPTAQSKQPSNDSQPSDSKAQQEQIDQLVKERNFLAQKVVNFESANNKRRSSVQGPQAQAIPSQEDELISDLEDKSKTNQTKNDIKQPLGLKHQNSAGFNKDLSGVMTFGHENEQSHHKESVSYSPERKPPKALHPFVALNTKQPQLKQGGQKNIKSIFKLILQNDIDIEKLLEENGHTKPRIAINQLYQILKEEQCFTDLSVEDMKELQSYVKEHSGSETEELGRGAKEEIDIQDLMNVMMDISLEIDNRDDSQPGGNRYSQDQRKDQSNAKDQQNEIRRLKDENLDLEDQYKLKMRTLQKTIQELNAEKNMLQEKVDKLESSKQRIERILKQNLGLKGSLKTTSGGGIDNNEIIEEIGLVMKRLEYLENQSDERGKQLSQDHGPCKREITRLYETLEEERRDKARLLAKKNAEVAYFKSELDAILGEMKNTMTRKQQNRSSSFKQ